MTRTHSGQADSTPNGGSSHIELPRPVTKRPIGDAFRIYAKRYAVSFALIVLNLALLAGILLALKYPSLLWAVVVIQVAALWVMYRSEKSVATKTWAQTLPSQTLFLGGRKRLLLSVAWLIDGIYVSINARRWILDTLMKVMRGRDRVYDWSEVEAELRKGRAG